MSKSNFTAVMAEVFAHEGGYANDPRDPGGETKYGISKRSYPKEDIRALTRTRAQEIYHRDFWTKIRGDDLPPGVDLVVMDAAVNSGVSRGVQWVQRATGATADGVIGPRTILKIKQASTVPLIRAACANRMGFLRGLRTWSTYGKGWMRRVSEVEAVATKMALKGMGSSSDNVAETLLKIAVEAKTSENQGMVAGVGSAGAGIVPLITAAADMPQWSPFLIGGAVILSAIHFLGRARIQSERAAAFTSIAEGA